MRIVSLCPSLTELIFDLGRGADLVGITRYCIHPAEGVASVEKVGGTKDPDLAQIIALSPDLVLFNEEENRREDHDTLRQSNIPVLNTFPKDALETAAMVRAIGTAIDCPEPAEQIANDIEARAARVSSAARERKPVRFAYLIWREPWMSVNQDTYASALLSLAGGQNIFADREERYPTIELSALVDHGVDLVLLCTEPFAFKAKHIDEIARATNLDPQRILIADGEYLSWHGSRTPDGLDYAESLIVR